MNKNIKKYLIVLLVSFFAASVFTMYGAEGVFAADDVELRGDSSGLVLVPEGGKLFDLGRMNPGDAITRTLKITNNYSRPFTLYMRAERIGDEPTGADLLKQLRLTISYQGEVIYRGPATGANSESSGGIGDISSNISLGRFASSESRNLIATIELPGPETGNEFQNATAEVRWIFTAETSGGGGGGGGGKKEEPIEEPPVEIEEEPVPEGEPIPPEIEIPEEAPQETAPIEIPVEEVPMGAPEMPKTGEELPYIYYVAGIVAIVAGASLTIRRK